MHFTSTVPKNWNDKTPFYYKRYLLYTSNMSKVQSYCVEHRIIKSSPRLSNHNIWHILSFTVTVKLFTNNCGAVTWIQHCCCYRGASFYLGQPPSLPTFKSSLYFPHPPPPSTCSLSHLDGYVQGYFKHVLYATLPPPTTTPTTSLLSRYQPIFLCSAHPALCCVIY